MPRSIVLVRHAERVDYAEKALGRNWMATADEPWNTPITHLGKEQATALGQAIRRHCEEAAIPLPTRALSSPMFRCVQTARAALDGMANPLAIGVEPGLTETMCENWYRSWGVPGADSTWGGHPGMQAGVEVPDDQMHPAAVAPSSGVLRACVEELSRHPELRVDAEYEAVVPIDYPPFRSYRFGCHEPESGRGTAADGGLDARLGNVLARELAVDDDETVLLVSHGSPSAAFFRLALGGESPRPGFTGKDEGGTKWNKGWPVCAYTGLYLLVPGVGGMCGLTARLAADTTHLAELASRGGGDGVVMAEQVRACDRE